MRILGWGTFALLMVVSLSPLLNLDDFEESTGILRIVAPMMCLMPFMFVNLFGASMVGRYLKGQAATKGRRVVATIVKTQYMGAEGSKHNTIPIYRFDLEVDYDGEIVRASTEVKSRNFDESSFPPGTKVSAVYDHSTGAIAMLDKDNRVVEYF
jgi:hypothetical protein